jgi:hypothetical protein
MVTRSVPTGLTVFSRETAAFHPQSISAIGDGPPLPVNRQTTSGAPGTRGHKLGPLLRQWTTVYDTPSIDLEEMVVTSQII